MSVPDKQQAGGPAQAATVKELKAALPSSTAEFREMCTEQGLSLAQATAMHEHQTKATEQAAAAATAGKKIGVAAVLGSPVPGGKTAAAVAGGGGVPMSRSEAKNALATAATQIAKDTGVPRHKAFVQACKENPEAHKALVVGHNLKFKRRNQAAAFAEQFEGAAADDD